MITRFAPSPTGFLHIGGARTALFNWLLARHNHGKFLLRIEDTDRKRSTQAAIDAILDGLSWLGLTWDEEPIYQSARAERHAEIGQSLLDEGLAYRCYCTPQELAIMRQEVGGYDRRWRDRPASDAPANRPYVIRLKAPLTGKIVVDDQVQGMVEFAAQTLDDLVLLRADGTPTYMLAVVVDDHDMGVTDIVRGDDHLTNAARQTLIYQACGWALPSMAHIPLIYGMDGKKLSKRHGALGIDAYRDMGFLPQALTNALARMGWSHGDQEIFSQDELVALFDLGQVGKAAARLDFERLAAINTHHMKLQNAERLLAMMKDISQDAKWLDDPAIGLRFQRGKDALVQRAQTLVDLRNSAGWLADGFVPDVSTLSSESRQMLAEFCTGLGSCQFTRQGLETYLGAFLADRHLKMRDLGPALRIALTGQKNAPSLVDLLLILGRDGSMSRLVGL